MSLEKWPVILPSQHSSANLVAFKEQLKCGATAACHTSACWNLHLKLEEHCNDCQEWLTLVIFLHKWHSSDSPKHTFHGQNVINTHSRPKDVGMIRKANKNKQIFWSCYSERSEALKIYLDSLIFCSGITALLANSCPTGQWFPLKTPHRHCHNPCPSIPTPSSQLWVRGNARGHVRNLQSHGEVALWAAPCLPRCHSWGGSGCSGVSHGPSASPWCSRNTSSRGDGFDVQCLLFPLLHGWKTTQSSTSECLMLRATINAMN